MIIKVTQKDIDNALPTNGYNCAVARALKRTLGNNTDLYVSTRSMVINEQVLDSPDHVVDFIKRFDNCEAVKPMSFVIPDYVFTPQTSVVATKKAKRQTKKVAVLV